MLHKLSNSTLLPLACFKHLMKHFQGLWKKLTEIISVKPHGKHVLLILHLVELGDSSMNFMELFGIPLNNCS